MEYSQPFVGDPATTEVHHPCTRTSSVGSVRSADSTSLLKQMRRHRAQTHKIRAKRLQTTVFSAAVHALKGLPQCVGCQHKLKTWSALKQHVRGNHCTSPGSGTSGRTPKSAAPNSDPSFQAYMQQDSWTDLPRTALADKLRQHCCLCARWFFDPIALKARSRTCLPLATSSTSETTRYAGCGAPRGLQNCDPAASPQFPSRSVCASSKFAALVALHDCRVVACCVVHSCAN